MPARQKSTIDLGVPIVPALRPCHHGNRHLQGNKKCPPPHLSSSLAQPSLPHPPLHPNMMSRVSSSMHQSAAGGRFFAGRLNRSTSNIHGESARVNKILSAMGRSSTEHDMKIRSRRSMAVGPFEDLPPHIRQHMVNTFNTY